MKTNYDWLTYVEENLRDSITTCGIGQNETKKVNYADKYDAKRFERAFVLKLPEIKKVVFSDPATIIFWSDNTKTVVKCQEGDIYDPEKGLAMAISKKYLGNKGNYNEVFKKWLPKEKEDKPEVLGQVIGAETNDRGVIARIVFGSSEAAQKLKESLMDAVYEDYIYHIAGVQTALSFHVNEEDK